MAIKGQALKPARSSARHRAREIALQALYSWKLGGGDVLAHAATLEGWQRCDQQFAAELIVEVVKKNDALEGFKEKHREISRWAKKKGLKTEEIVGKTEVLAGRDVEAGVEGLAAGKIEIPRSDRVQPIAQLHRRGDVAAFVLHRLHESVDGAGGVGGGRRRMIAAAASSQEQHRQ